jgi:uncharacterized LabA/DUF88 family protein
MAVVVVDAAYVHVGAASVARCRPATVDATTNDINGWSAEALRALDPAALRERIEEAAGDAVLAAAWCGARDGRFDSGGKALEAALARAGFRTSFRAIKVDEVICRNRDCDDARCPHRGPLRTPVRVRRQAGVDVDVACAALELVHAYGRGVELVLVAGDGDFLPLVEAARRAGARVAVAAFAHSLSPALADAADAVYDMDATWFRRRAPGRGPRKIRDAVARERADDARVPPGGGGDDDDDDRSDDDGGRRGRGCPRGRRASPRAALRALALAERLGGDNPALEDARAERLGGDGPAPRDALRAKVVGLDWLDAGAPRAAAAAAPAIVPAQVVARRRPSPPSPLPPVAARARSPPPRDDDGGGVRLGAAVSAFSPAAPSPPRPRRRATHPELDDDDDDAFSPATLGEAAAPPPARHPELDDDDTAETEVILFRPTTDPALFRPIPASMPT